MMGVRSTFVALCVAVPLAHAGASAPARADDSLCAPCHQRISDGFARSPMSKAFGPASAAAFDRSGSSATVDDVRVAYRYGVAATASGLTIEESRSAPEGFAAHRLAYPVTAVIGAGRRVQSLVVSIGDRWFFGPIEWNRERGFALAPGHEISPGLRFQNPITGECLSCHTTAPLSEDYPFNLAPVRAPFSGIGCDACHGDGRRHAETLERRDIVNPARLQWQRRMDVCARCHLQGDARLELTRAGLGGFHPGMDLFATRAVFVSDHPTDEFGFVSQTERLVLSRCFVSRPEALTCTACHDPHLPVSEDRRDRTLSVCASCHEPAHGGRGCARVPRPAETGDCVTCHMRRSAPFDVRGVEVTDHWIRRSPPPPAAPASIRMNESQGGAVVRFDYPGTPRPPTAASTRWDAGTLAMALVHLGQPSRAAALFAGFPPSGSAAAIAGAGPRERPALETLPLFHFLRGRALESSHDAEGARRSYEDALRLDPAHPETLVNLGLLHIQAGRWEAARSLLDRLRERYPESDAAFKNGALLEQRRGDLGAAADSLREALRRLPEGRTALALARILRAVDATHEALPFFRRAIDLDPDQESLWTQFGWALAASGDEATARLALREALRRNPADRAAREGLDRLGR